MGTSVEKLEKLDKLTKIGHLRKIATSLNKDKKYQSEAGDPVIGLINDMVADVETISTGSLVLDGILGGGFGKGRIVEVYGAPSSGKTSIAISTAANVQRSGGVAVYIDVENAFDPNYAKALGVNLDELFFSQPDSAEQAMELVSDLTKTKLVDLIVIDSVAAMVPKRELEGEAGDVTVGELARLLSKEIRKMIKAASRNGTTIIFINQTRDKIGGFSPFGTPTETPGGKALKFYASQRVQISKGKPITEGKDNTIGVEVKMKNVKNKIAPPFKVGETVITYAKGINREAEMIIEGPNYGVIHKPNNRRYEEASTGELIGTSKDAAIAKLKEDKEMFERLTTALSEAILNKKLGEDVIAENEKEYGDDDILDEELINDLEDEDDPENE